VGGEGPHSLDEVERVAVEAAMAEAGDNLAEAARRLGIARTTLYRKLRRYGMRS
jgi:transcriptional regulator of acetoin/glycerol metabolism